MSQQILISDPTLRDGNHAVQHQLDAAQIARYAKAAEAAGILVVEVGHGNGLGASSLQVGLSALSDREMLETARKELSNSKLGVHVMPGFATIKRDIAPALDIGVDVVRVASHCTEADITERHISFVRERGKEVYGTLMMTHMAPDDVLLEECRKLESYGANGVVLMDSAGASTPSEVERRIGTLVSNLEIPVGFHAHNNLGLAIANSIAAATAGASILDATARGFGAGAGNAQLEVLVPVLEKLGFETGIDLYKVLDLSDVAEDFLMPTLPRIRPVSIVSGLAGVFSGFAKHVERVAEEHGVDARDVFFELGRMGVVGGEEDKILEVAQRLSSKRGQSA